jgi:hypothetical protein
MLSLRDSQRATNDMLALLNKKIKLSRCEHVRRHLITTIRLEADSLHSDDEVLWMFQYAIMDGKVLNTLATLDVDVYAEVHVHTRTAVLTTVMIMAFYCEDELNVAMSRLSGIKACYNLY